MSTRTLSRPPPGSPWFTAAIATAVVIVIADVVTADRVVLIPLLVVPALLAAIGSGALRTAAIGAACVAVAVPLGAFDGIFVERPHLIDLAVIAAVALITTLIARLRERLEAAERRSALVADAGAALQRSLDPEEALDELARLAVPLVGDWCAVHVKEDDGSISQVAVAHRDPDKVALAREFSRRHPPDPERASGVPNVIRTGEPEVYERIPTSLLESAAPDEESLEALKSLGMSSSLMLPLNARGRTRGAITFTLAESGRRFGADERRLADTLAERAAVALDNMHLYARAAEVETELRQSRDLLGAILDGVADGVTAQDSTGKMIYANEAALELLGFPSVEAIQAVPIRYVLSRFDIFDEDGAPFPLERLPGRQALMGEKPGDALVRFRRRDTGDDRWSIIKATPITDPEGRVVMSINVYEDVTDHIERQRSQRLLARVGEVLTTSLTYEKTLGRVADLCVPEVADIVAVDVLEGSEIRRVAVAAHNEAAVKEVLSMRRRHPLDPEARTGVPAVIRTGATELYPHLEPADFAYEAASPQHAGLIERLGLRSAMFVPLSARGRTFGAMTFCAAERSFDESDLYLAEELAARCAIAIDNARLFRERTRIARTLQESLLPPVLPELPGVDVGARFQAAGEGYEVGGDFYDVFEIGGGSFGVTIGDVCGKGPDAAAVTALARYTARATAMREPSPAEVLRTLNEAMLRHQGDRRFCTVAYARFDPTPTGLRATVAAGGHPLPLALRVARPPVEAGTPGTLLGVVTDPVIEDVGIDLGPGDSLVLFTDGVTEARAPQKVYGSTDLAAFVGEHEALRAEAIAKRIERGALSARADEPRDDVAIVVVKVAEPGVPPLRLERGEGVGAV